MALVPVSSTAPTYFEITTAEAFKVQTELINEWKPKREVWSLKYGEHIMGVVAGINGLIINSSFRNKLKLHHHGLIFTSTALALTPTFMTTITHNYHITKNFLLYRDDCLACQYLKGISGIQLFGIVFPTIAAPLINIAIAGNLGYRVPYITEGRDLLKFWWSAVKPACNRFLLLSIFNCSMACVIVYKQSVAIDNVKNILLRIQEKVNNGTIKLEE